MTQEYEEPISRGDAIVTQAIKFSDFLLEYGYEPSFSKKWIDFSRSGDNRLTSEDAYNQFIEQQNKSND